MAFPDGSEGMTVAYISSQRLIVKQRRRGTLSEQLSVQKIISKDRHLLLGRREARATNRADEEK